MSVKEGIIDSNHLKFSFQIENFTDNLNAILRSQKIFFAQGLWYILIKANKDNEFVDICLHKSLAGTDNHVSCKISILVKEKSIVSHSLTHKFTKAEGVGWSKFISRIDLIRKISPQFSFTIACELKLIDDIKFYSSDGVKVFSQYKSVCTRHFHDLKIQVKGSDQILSAHRNIVAAKSPVLRTKILKLSSSDPLKIEGFRLEVVQEVLKFIYNKKVNKTDENVKQILLAAKEYQIPDLQTQCKIFLFRTLNIQNALDSLIFAYDNLFLSLRNEIVCFLNENIDILLKKEMNQWKQLVEERPDILKYLFQKIMEGRPKKLKNCKLTLKKSAKTNENYKVDCNGMAKDYEHLLKFFGCQEFPDVVLEVEGKTLKAHKSILTSGSTVFTAMFDALEARENRLEITDINYSTMNQILQFIYCGKVTGLKENAINLFSAAEKYDLIKLKDVCRNSMEQNVTIDNITGILKLSYLHSSYLIDLKELATIFFRKNFENIFKTPKWSQFAISSPKILSNMLIKILGDLK